MKGRWRPANSEHVEVSKSANKTGPHTVKLYQRLRNGIDVVYRVQLSIDYCDRNINDMKSSAAIILEPYEPQMRQQSHESFHKVPTLPRRWMI
uniref:Cystatin domain-containing protein n=1 Tax=Globodera pallida TaxID=36090 RepID=A0A183BM30_GLOPA